MRFVLSNPTRQSAFQFLLCSFTALLVLSLLSVATLTAQAKPAVPHAVKKAVAQQSPVPPLHTAQASRQPAGIHAQSDDDLTTVLGLMIALLYGQNNQNQAPVQPQPAPPTQTTFTGSNYQDYTNPNQNFPSIFSYYGLNQGFVNVQGEQADVNSINAINENDAGISNQVIPGGLLRKAQSKHAAASPQDAQNTTSFGVGGFQTLNQTLADFVSYISTGSTITPYSTYGVGPQGNGTLQVNFFTDPQGNGFGSSIGYMYVNLPQWVGGVYGQFPCIINANSFRYFNGMSTLAYEGMGIRFDDATGNNGGVSSVILDDAGNKYTYEGEFGNGYSPRYAITGTSASGTQFTINGHAQADGSQQISETIGGYLLHIVLNEDGSGEMTVFDSSHTLIVTITFNADGSGSYIYSNGASGTFDSLSVFLSDPNVFVPPTVVSVQSVTFNPTSVTGGDPANDSTTGTVTLSDPAPTGGATVSLAASDTAAAVPLNVVVPAGQTYATFNVTAEAAVTASEDVTITATYSTSSQQGTLTINPPAPPVTLVSVSVNPTSVTGGDSATGTVTLSGPAPTIGANLVSVSSDSSAVTVSPSSVGLSGGQTTATFDVTTQTVTSPVTATITAIYNDGTPVTTTLTVNPATPAVTLVSVSVNPMSVTGGGSVQGTATLSGPAPAGGVMVSLSTSDTMAAIVPDSVSVAEGQTIATFDVATAMVTSPVSVTLTAVSNNGIPATTTLTVNPAAQTASFTAIHTAAGPDGSYALLWTRPDGAAFVETVSATGASVNSPTFGPYTSATARSLAVAPDGTIRLLWGTTAGAGNVWVLNSAAQPTSYGFTYGPYSGAQAIAIAIAPDGTTRLLWTNDGAVSVWLLDAAGRPVSYGRTYGPYPGAGARTITVGTDGLTRLLWTRDDGAANVWTLNNNGYPLSYGYVYGPYTGAGVTGIAAAPDGTTRMLWTRNDGSASVWTLNGSGVPISYGRVYGPYNGAAATDISVGPDNLSDLLWTNTTGVANVWAVNSTGVPTSYGYVFGPF